MLECSPTNISVETLIDKIESIPTVRRVEEARLWSICEGKSVFAGKIVVENHSNHLLHQIKKTLKKQGIFHTYIEMEIEN